MRSDKNKITEISFLLMNFALNFSYTGELS